jgi:phospholipid/cholesterol/gamma-HCH transport system substrate-binding protein
LTRANYFKIGAFILAGTGLLLAMLLVLGAGVLFRQYRLVETYFDSSVEGLEQGAAVTFRGVPIGRVETIAPVAARYQTSRPYVLVRLAVETGAFGDHRPDSDRFMLEEHGRGLRLRLNLRGVTGTALLEADYLDARRFPPLEIDWTPDYPYIPSAPSAMQLLTASADRIMTGLHDLDIIQLTSALQRTLTAMSETLEGIDSRQLSVEAQKLLVDLQQTNGQMNALLQEGTATVSDLRVLAGEVRPPLKRLLSAAAEAAVRLEKMTGELAMTGDLPETLKRLRQTVSQFENLVSDNQHDIGATVNNLRIFSEDLREISEEARRHPSRLFFGAPPPPAEPWE